MLKRRTYDLTMPLDGAVRVRDYRQTLVLRSSTTLDGLQRISDLELFPHSVSHIDLPTRMEWAQDDLADFLTDGDLHPHHVDHFSPSGTLQSNRAYPCTIVSLPDLTDVMRDFCRQTWPDTGTPWHPYDRWSEDTFTRLIRALQIPYDRLIKTPIRQGDFVLFLTGWREFAPSDGDLTHPSWTPWHPYLMNPYMAEAAVNHLFSPAVGIAGIGCDVGTLDCPLRHSLNDAAAAAITYDFEKLRDDPTFCPGIRLKGSDRFWAVHRATLARLKPLVEQLYIPPQLHRHLTQTTEGFPYLQGTIVLLPHRNRQSRDAVLVSALFVTTDPQEKQ